MRRLFLVVLLLALAGGRLAQAEEIHLEINRTEPTIKAPKAPAEGIGIKGKWGLGVGVGSGEKNALNPETYLIRGKTARTAWILDLNINQSYTEIRDTLGAGSLMRSQTLGFGPRLRRFTRPQERLSPYWDVYFNLDGGRSSSTYSPTNFSVSNSFVRAQAGIEGGVEYFTPWHFSLAAHTPFFMMHLDRRWDKSQGRVYSREWLEDFEVRISPYLHVRVYF